MISDGERIEGHVQLVRVLMTRDGTTFDEALAAAGALVPAEDHEAVLRHYRRQTSTTIEVLEPGVLSDGGPRAWFDGYDPPGLLLAATTRLPGTHAGPQGLRDRQSRPVQQQGTGTPRRPAAHPSHSRSAAWSWPCPEWQDRQFLGADRQGSRRRLQDRNRPIWAAQHLAPADPAAA